MDFNKYTKLNPVQKTIRFELKPIGKSLDNLNKSGLLDRDRQLAECYPIMKDMIDEYHKAFINSHLEGYDADWTSLSNAIQNNRESNPDNRDKNRKELERIKSEYREKIVERFTSDDDFELLGTEKLFSVLMKDVVENEGTDEQKHAFEVFNKFSGYFIGLHENRMNLYDKGSKSTAIAFRLVDQNFPTHLNNCRSYERALRLYPEAISGAEKELGIDLHSVFTVNNYNKLLDQAGIDHYNEIIGGIAFSERDHVKGINQFLNEYRQKNPGSERILLRPLYKLMLNEKGTRSFIPKAFGSDKEVCESVASFVQNIDDAGTLRKIDALFRELSDGHFDFTGILVTASALPSISSKIYGRWDTLNEVMRRYYAEKLGDPTLLKTAKKVDKLLSAKAFSLSEISEAIVSDDSSNTVSVFIQSISDSAKSAQDKLTDVRKLIDITNVRTQEGSRVIRDILEPMLDLVRDLKSFQSSSEDGRNEKFYQEFDLLNDDLFAVVRLYNKVRNYCTKKEYNTDKFKMNFGNSTLGNGWSVGKETSYNCILLRKENDYYLGIMDPNRKTNFQTITNAVSGDFYEKMDYHYIGNPARMLPKIFLASAKWKKDHPLPAEIEAAYQDKRDNEVSFSPELETELIRYYQSCIPQYPDWKAFDFRLKDLEDYSGLKDFCKNLSNQGYKVSFRPIDAIIIDEMVDDGRLFLFRLYNKDFSEASKSLENPERANLHTIYWKAAFSKENLRNVVIKLNGDAELFYRKKSDFSPALHRKGDIILRRTCPDGTPVPESIFCEIMRYMTHPGIELSEEAQHYLPLVNPRPAPHDIQKDRRYTVDKMFLHVPLTFNFGCDPQSSSTINNMILADSVNSEDIRIIGIDRGERNLLYYCLINGKGEILKQHSLNIIDGYDYHKKLDDREKERLNDRRNWNTVKNISNLKEGYISKAVHEIVTLAVENNALIVLEDLNFGFKRGRFKIEKQVYQKFESMLLNKLSHLVLKGRCAGEPGGVLNAYQLSPPFESFAKLGKQSGIVLYVPAAFTSRIDPVTGFADVFSRGSDTLANKRDFLSRMSCIEYVPSEDCFSFTFDYRKFQTTFAIGKPVWTVYTRGERIVYSKKDMAYSTVSPTIVMKNALALTGANLNGDLKERILSDDELVKATYRSFDLSLRMRNSDSARDYIISPVKRNGRFYCS